MKSISLDTLVKYVSYDRETGEFTRIKKIAGTGVVGSRAGFKRGFGYRGMSIEGTTYPEHWLAWLWCHGAMPKNQIDHINGNRSDNRISNLREVTPSQNSQNQRRAKKHNSTGVLGVYKYGDRFRARIRYGGRLHCLGIHKTAEEAYAAYVEAKRLHHEGNTL